MGHDPWDSISGDKKFPDWVVDEDEDEALAYDRRLLTRLGEWSPIKSEAHCTRGACAICRKDRDRWGQTSSPTPRDNSESTQWIINVSENCQNNQGALCDLTPDKRVARTTNGPAAVYPPRRTPNTPTLIPYKTAKGQRGQLRGTFS
jgi:hypothetical protein